MVRATWAPRGQTPVLRPQVQLEADEHVRGAVLPPGPLGRGAGVRHPTGRLHYRDLIDFLAGCTHVGQDAKLTLLWDGLSSHRSRDMTAFIASCRGWLRVNACRPTPRTQPGRRPVGQRQRNRTGQPLPDTIDEAMPAACDGLDRGANDTDLCFVLLRHTGLSL